MTKSTESLAIGWRLSSVSGWGVYGLNLTLQLLEKSRTPVLLLPPHLLSMDETTQTKLTPVLKRQEMMTEIFEKGTVSKLELDYPVLFALRNDIQPALEEQLVRGNKNIGVIFFEGTALSEDALTRARDYDLIVTGSTWNEQVLREHGLTHVTTVFQGIDPDRFRPARQAKLFSNRFVVFSGGKFEYRKAQDAVVAAFRQFRQRHTDALLVFAWANQWTNVLNEIETADLVSGTPALGTEGTIEFAKWLTANGLPPDSFVDLGMPANHEMPIHLAPADVGLFPNRCEPGTNLVAMETMACGVPCILSSNTGHLDLIDGANCFALQRQEMVEPVTTYPDVTGWGEPDIAEIVECLEDAYNDRKERLQRGAAGAETLQKFAWTHQIDALLKAVDTTLNPM